MVNEIENKQANNSKKNGSADVVNLGSVFKKFVYHWPLYILVFCIAIVLANIYLRYAKPVYTSIAKIYIKDDKGGSGQASAFSDITGFGGNKVVENEMEIIRSPLILQDVIREKKFNIRYFLNGKVGTKELYDDTPLEIKIITDSSKVGNYLFDVQFKENQISVSESGKKTPPIYVQPNSSFTCKKDRFIIQYFPERNLNKDKNFSIRIDSITPLAYKKADEIKTTIINSMSSVFKLSYQDAIAKRTADFLNAVLMTYNNYTLSDKNLITKNTIQFINGRLDSLGRELEDVERHVETFKKERGITEIQENSKVILDQAREADQRLNESNIQLSVFEKVQKFVDNPQSTAPLMPLGVTDPTLSSMVDKYQNLLSERKRLQLSVQPGNVLLQNVEQQLADNRTSIKNYIAGFKKNAVTVQGALQRRVNKIEGSINKVPTYEREFIGIKRQQGVKEQLYLYLLQKKEESAVSYASNIIHNKIISPAFIPEIPTKPLKPLIYTAFLFAAFILTSLYLFLKYSLNDSINTKRDIEKITDLPVIAEIFRDEETTGKAVVFNERSVLREQIMNLRNSLKFMLANVTGSPVILFTSSVSGEGKTFLSSQLASALTNNNKTAILLELDLRKPKLSSSLGISNSSGITNFIIGAETIDQIIKKVPNTERLYLVPSGPVPPNPIELLESNQMKELINILKQRYDYVIIDTSPIGLVSDAKSLAPLVDCGLFVIRFNYTPKGKLEEISEDLQLTAFKKMGIIFNGIDIQSSFAYSGYGYSKYGYGYGNVSTTSLGFSAFVRKLKSRLL
jgi:capsular exopolysaccharide synthesis family protein